MADEPYFQIGTDERVIDTGATGTGKTLVMKRLLLPYVPPSMCVVIFDPKHDKHWREIPDLGFTRLPLVGGRVKLEAGTVRAYRWPSKTDDDDLAEEAGYNAVLRAIWKHGHTIIIQDETSLVYNDPQSMNAIMGKIIRAGRQRNIGIWWLLQQPSNVPSIILTEAEQWLVFTLRRIEDRKRVATYLDDDTLLYLPKQEDHGRSHYFYYGNINMPESKMFRLHLPEDEQQAPEQAPKEIAA